MLALRSQKYTRASSASEICDNNDIDCCIVVSGATSPEVSPSDGLQKAAMVLLQVLVHQI